MLGAHVSPQRACEVNHSILLTRAGKHREKHGVSTSPLQGSIQDIIPIQWHNTYYSELKINVTGEHVHPLSKRGNHALANSHFLIISSFVAFSILSCIPQCFIQTALCTWLSLFSPLLGDLPPYRITFVFCMLTSTDL